MPVGDGLSGNSAVHGSLGHCSTHFGNEAWVDRFRDEVVATEGQVVHLIDVVHHIGHSFLGQIGNGKCSSHLHLLIDGASMHVECTTEDVGESNDVVDLVGIVRAACCHEHIRTAVHGILIGNLWNRIGQSKHDGVFSHGTNHVLRHHVSL